MIKTEIEVKCVDCCSWEGEGSEIRWVLLVHLDDTTCSVAEQTGTDLRVKDTFLEYGTDKA